MITSWTKRLLRRAWDWMEQDASRRRDEARANWLAWYAYGPLNAIFTELLAEDSTLRAHYTWGVLQAAHLAKVLSIDRISVIEFGVAGGKGLLSLERAAAKIGARLGLVIDTYGFDTGVGLPAPSDYRDLPNVFSHGDYVMNVPQLQSQLTTAQLIIGPIKDTIAEFVRSDPSPVAFIAVDVDYYSSTVDVFKLLEAPDRVLLPRIHCYFDDIVAFTISDYTGQRLAIAEYNACHDTRKISPMYGLWHFLPDRYAHAIWTEMIYMVHIFDHPSYCRPDGLVRTTTCTQLGAHRSG